MNINYKLRLSLINKRSIHDKIVQSFYEGETQTLATLLLRIGINWTHEYMEHVTDQGVSKDYQNVINEINVMLKNGTMKAGIMPAYKQTPLPEYIHLSLV